jgi:hypothetical protein
VSITLGLDGAATLKQVADTIRSEGRKDLSKELGDALARAAKPIQADIKEQYQQLPSGGGYRGLFSRSLNFRATRRGARYTLVTYADGTKERRDIRALESGSLRHPIYGRSRKVKRGKKTGSVRKNPWAVTRVRGGFHERGTDQAAEHARQEVLAVVKDFAQRLIS